MSIELNNTEVLSNAVDAMIEKLDRRSPVLYWLLEYIEERIVNDRRWDVSKDIKGFGQNIFDENYIEKGRRNCAGNWPTRTLFLPTGMS